MLKAPVLSFVLRQSLQGILVTLQGQAGGRVRRRKARSCDCKLFFYIKVVVFIFELIYDSFFRGLKQCPPKGHIHPEPQDVIL